MWWTLLSSGVVLGLVLESRRRQLAVVALWGVAAPFLKATARPRRSENEQRAYVAALNEATLEIGSGLARAGGVPRRCAKAALWFSALVALVEASERVRGDGSAWLAPIVSFLGGCVGAFACAFIGRAAEAEARRLRSDWATLIRRSSRDVPT